MTTNYRRGYDFEMRIKKEWERRGCWVIRAAGSKGEADLVAFPRAGSSLLPWLIQCKWSKGGISGKERKALVDLARSIGAHAVVYLRAGRAAKRADLR